MKRHEIVLPGMSSTIAQLDQVLRGTITITRMTITTI